MKISQSEARKITENKLLNNERVKNIIEKYNERITFASQRRRDEISIYRTGLYISDPIDESQAYDSTGGKKLDYIAYCDISFETGECSDVVFLDSFEEFE